MKKEITTLFICLLTVSLFASRKDTTSASATPQMKPQSTAKADAAFAKQSYREAYNLYYPALQTDVKNPNLNFKVALCNLYLLHQPKKSIELVKTALNNYSDKYDFYNGKQISAPTDAFYYLGKSFMYDGQIDTGMQYLVYYQNKVRDDLSLDASRQLKMCINARQLMRHPRELNVKETEGPVNSEYDESNPVVSLDNKTLFFASRRPDKKTEDNTIRDNDIYFSTANGSGEWSSPIAFPFNTAADEEPVYISANGNTLYFRRADKNSGDIYFTEKNGEQWGTPKKLANINSAFDEKAISISNDGTMMIVCSNKPGGLGGYDLYVAKGKDGKWGSLKNMGSKVNTDMDEISPFIFPNGKRVYFSSNGNTEFGMGGFDIFFTETDSNSKAWSKAYTLGYPVNRSGNEVDYTMGGQGKTMYAAVGKNGDLDLFDIVAGEFKEDVQEQITEVVGTRETQTVEVVEVEKEKKVEVEKQVEVSKVEEIEKEVEKNVGYVNAEDAKKLDKVVEVKKEEVEVQNIVETEKIVYTNQPQHIIDSMNGIAVEVKSNETPVVANNQKMRGSSEVTTNITPPPSSPGTVTSNVNVEVIEKVEEKKFFTPEVKEKAAEKVFANVSKDDKEAVIQKIKDDLEKEMKENRRAVFKTFFFGFNSAALELKNYELKILVDFLKEHKDVNIEVDGYTDNVGSWETNFNISNQRAKSVFDYLKLNKISGSRMIFNGKGPIQPMASNDTEEGRSKNRRVEIILIQEIMLHPVYSALQIKNHRK